jgi:hypothetical protein
LYVRKDEVEVANSVFEDQRAPKNVEEIDAIGDFDNFMRSGSKGRSKEIAKIRVVFRQQESTMRQGRHFVLDFGA